jgi:cobalamin-dependent methionine synthase I
MNRQERTVSERREFTVVGENIHCTRIYKVGGKFVSSEGDTHVILYGVEGEKRLLPVPDVFTKGEDWNNGKVKHAAVGIWQGINAADENTRQAGVDYLRFMARRQEQSGASFLDLNVDEYGTDAQERIEALKWLVGVVQQAVSVPMSIDSSNVEILEAGLAACDGSRGKPLVNSVSLERLTAVDIAQRAGAVVIAGAMGRTAMPDSKEERLQNLEELFARLRRVGFEDSEIYLDPLIFPISVNSENGTVVLNCIRELRENLGGQIHFAPGLSNISFGMPNRKLLNQVFAYLCREEGLDGGIVDPLQINGQILDGMEAESKSFQLARAVLTGEDEYGMNYITAAREGRL